ncbi:TPA: hypothetical protein QEL15_003324 [Stenotrophomonas maltophilia]|nr:hypothetical protein [Stenotrophomonas maltophilia]
MNVGGASIQKILDGEMAICFFVHRSAFYWVMDDRANFSLDAEKDYRAYLDRGHISASQYDAACREFRGGILRLDENNFLEYLRAAGGGYTTDEMAAMFKTNDADVGDPLGLHARVERFNVSGSGLAKGDFMAAERLAARLPGFYVNFDRKVFLHMESDRFHEDLAYPDWEAGFGDFCHLVPDGARYWMDGADFWKVRFIHGCDERLPAR